MAWLTDIEEEHLVLATEHAEQAAQRQRPSITGEADMGHFTQYSVRDGLSSDFTTCLFEDHAGTLWICTDGGGVSAFSRGHFTSYTIAHGLPSK